jgi:4-hydroxy-tetrahydrodipicolinate synthase
MKTRESGWLNSRSRRMNIRFRNQYIGGNVQLPEVSVGRGRHAVRESAGLESLAAGDDVGSGYSIPPARLLSWSTVGIHAPRRMVQIRFQEPPAMKVAWRGVHPAATTQFRADQSLALPETMKHLDAMIAAGVHGLIMLGTVGENCSLEFSEKLDVLRATVKHVAGRVPVLTGVAECSTRLACRFAAEAQKIGVQGLMVLPAMVYKSDPRETISHFRTVARATDLPIMCYNNPVSYSVDITPPMFQDLADEAKFVAIKESSENVRRITDLKNACGERYLLFCGVDDLVLESVLLGAVGWVSGLVNAFPAENRLLWDLATSGKYEQALAVYRWYTPLLHLDTHIKLVQYIKLAMAETGLGSEVVREPRLPLVGEEREEILALVRQAIRTRPTA